MLTIVTSLNEYLPKERDWEQLYLIHVQMRFLYSAKNLLLSTFAPVTNHTISSPYMHVITWTCIYTLNGENCFLIFLLNINFFNNFMFDFFTQVYNHALKRSILKGAYGNITTFLSFKTLYNKTDVSFFKF